MQIIGAARPKSVANEGLFINSITDLYRTSVPYYVVLNISLLVGEPFVIFHSACESVILCLRNFHAETLLCLKKYRPLTS